MTITVQCWSPGLRRAPRCAVTVDKREAAKRRWSVMHSAPAPRPSRRVHRAGHGWRRFFFAPRNTVLGKRLCLVWSNTVVLACSQRGSCAQALCSPRAFRSVTQGYRIHRLVRRQGVQRHRCKVGMSGIGRFFSSSCAMGDNEPSQHGISSPSPALIPRGGECGRSAELARCDVGSLLLRLCDR
jgi:hypothetical protein